MSSDKHKSQALSTSQRSEIELRLKSYDIPIQILQMVARENNCVIDAHTATGKVIKRNILELLLPQMDDRSIVMLHEIFLECRDSYSHFRFAAFLSSVYSPLKHKFVIDDKLIGPSGEGIVFDVCVYGRESGSLVAVGVQNNDSDSRPASNDSVLSFLTAVKSLNATHPHLKGAYYASSYGYDLENGIPKLSARNAESPDSPQVIVKFLEYRDKVYFEKSVLGSA